MGETIPERFKWLNLRQNDERSVAKTLPETDLNGCSAKSSVKIGVDFNIIII